MPVPLLVSVFPNRISGGANKTVIYPQISYPKDLSFEGYVNQTIFNQAQKLIQQQIGNLPSSLEEMDGYFELKNNQRNVLLLTLGNYAYHYKAAHGLTIIKALNFDLERKKLLQLKDLFKPGSNYIQRISRNIHEQIIKRDLPVINEFTEIRPNQDYYLADKSLVVFFQLYDLVPYAYGFPMFPISLYEVQDIIDDKGPAARLMARN